jgi:hypothetical protein
MLRNATDAATGVDGWARLGQVGREIGNRASFDARTYGYRQLSDLVEATERFEVGRRRKVVAFIRERRKA